MKALINELNRLDFRAFPQKADPRKVTLSVKGEGEDQNRYFLTRVACGTNGDGTAKYMWARGAQMRPQTPQA